jgi:hypothetical protein
MSCADSIKAHPWKAFTDTANCYKVFQVVRGFSTGVYTKDEAKEKFKNIDLGDIESFRPHIRDIIKDIIKEDIVVVETAKEIKNTVVENAEEVIKVEEVKLEESEVVEDVIKPTVSRKRNYRVETE